MKNRLALFIVILLLISILPISAMAASGTISANGTYDIGDYGNGSTITIGAGLTVTLTNLSNSTYENMSIVCGEGTALTIDHVKIRSDACALSFTGSGNALILISDSALSSGYNVPGILVEEGTDLTISGTGYVNINGGNQSAGIGSRNHFDTGAINIQSGTIFVQGGMEGAGIGGSNEGDAGTISISGGTIHAFGGADSAAIGGGAGGDGGDITISGGTVIAKGFSGGAGIGGGDFGGGGYITISGGTVTAVGGESGAGIGGGSSGTDGVIRISGGMVIATRGGYGMFASYDIGSGLYGTFPRSVSLSGDGVLILTTGSIGDIYPTSHKRYYITYDTNNEVYGIDLPYGANNRAYGIPNVPTPPFAIYILPYTLSYNDNGGSGIVPDSVTQHVGTTAVIGHVNVLTRSNYTFGGWNTASDGSGTSYADASTFTFTADTTLYAVWNKIWVSDVSLNSHTEELAHNDTVRLTASVAPHNATNPTVTWTSSDESVATVSQSGLVTTASAGNAVISATADGKTDTCAVRVTQVFWNYSIEVGDSLHLLVSVNPVAPVRWTSSNTSIVTVDENGNASAISEGSAIVTATSEGVSTACYIDVSAPEALTSPAPDPTTPTPQPTIEPVVPPITPHEVTPDDKKGTVTVAVHKDSLPKGTQSVKTSSGDVAHIDKDGIAKVEVPQSEIDDDGQITITALDQQQEHIGSVDVQVTSAKAQQSGWDKTGPMLMWVLIGIIVLITAGTITLLVRMRNRKR